EGCLNQTVFCALSAAHFLRPDQATSLGTETDIYGSTHFSREYGDELFVWLEQHFEHVFSCIRASGDTARNRGVACPQRRASPAFLVRHPDPVHEGARRQGLRGAEGRTAGGYRQPFLRRA